MLSVRFDAITLQPMRGKIGQIAGKLPFTYDAPTCATTPGLLWAMAATTAGINGRRTAMSFPAHE